MKKVLNISSLLKDILGCCLGVSMVASVANATVVVRASLQDLVKNSQVVVHGRVVNVNDAVATSDQGPFLTQVSMEIVETMKGLAASEKLFTFDIPGGRSQNLVMQIPGMPQFHVGDEVVMMLESTKFGFVPTGLSQGVFQVKRAEAASTLAGQSAGNGALIATRDFSDTTFVDPNGSVLKHDLKGGSTLLPTLLTQVRSYATIP